MNFLKVTLTASFTYLGYYNNTTVLCHVSLCYRQKYKHQTKTILHLWISLVISQNRLLVVKEWSGLSQLKN